MTEYLSTINKLPDIDITTSKANQDFYGLKLFILSPTQRKLNQLRKKYPPSVHKLLEQNELSSISEATAVKAYDYHIPIESFDLNNWKEDNSVENGSSIAVLTEFQGKKILWLADAHPSVIVKALRGMGYSKVNQLVCDWVKVNHHGSKANNSNELYDLIRCCNYLMSVNGENQHYLPTKECIARILRNPNRESGSIYRFYFTYDNVTLRSIFKVDGEQVYKRWNFTVNFLSNNKWVPVH